MIFFILNFTDSFLDLGIGKEQVGVSRGEIQGFDAGLYHDISHWHIAVAGFIAATCAHDDLQRQLRRGASPGLIVAALVCTVMMAGVMFMGHDHHRQPDNNDSYPPLGLRRSTQCNGSTNTYEDFIYRTGAAAETAVA